ncbi:hypothetical protein BRAO285_830003 [Bradyrhizobium sp. ORS 285]|nr:hypothetical protein BRAO285_830003 [Bradyrhizobium sp. ORS 285]
MKAGLLSWRQRSPLGQGDTGVAKRTEIILAGAPPVILIAGAPALGKVSDEITAAPIRVASFDDDSGSAEASATSREVGLGKNACTLPVSAQRPSLISCQKPITRASGEGAKNCAPCLHAHADHHPKHDDRAWRKWIISHHALR